MDTSYDNKRSNVQGSIPLDLRLTSKSECSKSKADYCIQTVNCQKWEYSSALVLGDYTNIEFSVGFTRIF